MGRSEKRDQEPPAPSEIGGRFDSAAELATLILIGAQVELDPGIMTFGERDTRYDEEPFEAVAG